MAEPLFLFIRPAISFTLSCSFHRPSRRITRLTARRQSSCRPVCSSSDERFVTRRRKRISNLLRQEFSPARACTGNSWLSSEERSRCRAENSMASERDWSNQRETVKYRSARVPAKFIFSSRHRGSCRITVFHCTFRCSATRDWKLPILWKSLETRTRRLQRWIQRVHETR